MAHPVQSCLLFLAAYFVSTDGYDTPRMSYQNPLEPSWQSTETLENDKRHSTISERFVQHIRSNEAESIRQQSLHTAQLVSLLSLESSWQESDDEGTVSTVPELEDVPEEKQRQARLFNSRLPFPFGPLQILASGIGGLFQPFVNPNGLPVGQIEVGGPFPQVTTVYSTQYSSRFSTAMATIVVTKNTYWTTTTTSTSVILSPSATSSTTTVSVSVTTSPSTALTTFSSTASSSQSDTSTYTSSSTASSVSTSVSTTTAMTTYSSTEVPVSTTTLATQTSISTTTVTNTAYTSTATSFVTSTDTSSVTVPVCVTDAAQAAVLIG